MHNITLTFYLKQSSKESHSMLHLEFLMLVRTIPKVLKFVVCQDLEVTLESHDKKASSHEFLYMKNSSHEFYNSTETPNQITAWRDGTPHLSV